MQFANQFRIRLIYYFIKDIWNIFQRLPSYLNRTIASASIVSSSSVCLVNVSLSLKEWLASLSVNSIILPLLSSIVGSSIRYRHEHPELLSNYKSAFLH